MEISVAIPVFNEEKAIKKVIEELIFFLSENNLNFELVIIDDGSTDSTFSILQRFRNKGFKMKIIRHRYRQGIGLAIKDALLNSQNEWIFMFPGDGQASPLDLLKMLKFTSNYDIIVGVREKRADPRYRYITSDIWKFLIRFFFGISFKDINWIKLIKREVLQSLDIKSKSAFIDSEILLRAKKKGFRMIEVPVSHRERFGGKTKCLAPLIAFDALKDMAKLRKEIREK